MYKHQRPIISIIVPIYNTGKYLEKCLESIINQSFTNFEVICIDDGSTDNSYDILTRYKEKYNNFKIIYQENQGVAIARNNGLKNANGDYIIFIDSDDFIINDYLEKLYNESVMTNADVVICNFYRYYEDTSISIPVMYKKNKGIYTSNEILKALIPDNLIHSYLWNKLWKRELFNNLSFPDIKYEDIAIMCHLFYKAKKISIINDSLYYYRIRKTSIVRSYSITTQNDYMKAYMYTRIFLKENKIYDEFKYSFRLLSIKVFLVMFFINIFLIKEYNNLNITKENFKEIYKFIRIADSNEFSISKEDINSLEVLHVPREYYNKSTE